MQKFGWTALAAGLLALAGGGVAGADDDTMRLGGPGVSVDGDVNTELVYYRGGWGGGWGRGGWGGWGGGWGGYPGWGGWNRGGFSLGISVGRGWGGYPGWGGWNRGGWGGGFYGRPYWGGGWGGFYGRPYWGGGWGGGYYGGGWGGGYYGTPIFSYSSYSYPVYYSSAYYYPCVDEAQSSSVVTLSEPVQPVTPSYEAAPVQSVAPALNYAAQQSALQQRAAAPRPAPRQLGEQPYEYDGGPRQVVPMPAPESGTPTPSSRPRPSVPLEGRFVSLPAETTGGTSPVYTVAFRQASQEQANPAPAGTRAAQPRYGYRAYGE